MRKKVAAYLCTGLLLLMTAGCGNFNADQDAATVDSINYSDTIDTDTEENNSSHQSDTENVDNQQESSQKESDSQSSEGSTNNQPDDSVGNGDSQENNNEDIAQKSNSTQTQTDDVQQQSVSKLDGYIESIGDNSVTISKTLHPSENLAVSSNELVTVYFSEKTEFEVWTVKNGGVNGDADTEKRQAAFSDLNLGADINMTGSYDGNDFNADYVIIYNFV